MRRKALKDFSSTVWGNVAAGEFFEFDEGYKADLVSWGVIAPDAPAPVVKEGAGRAVVGEDDPKAAFAAALTGQAPVKRGRK
jgi:hypothetical protein